MSATEAMTWIEPVRVVIDRLGDGFDALWAVVYTGQLAALQLAMHAPPGEGMALSGAAWDLGDALGEIEWVRPELAAHGVAVDLGPAPLDDAGSCRDALAGVLRLGVDIVDRILHQHTTPDGGTGTGYRHGRGRRYRGAVRAGPRGHPARPRARRGGRGAPVTGPQPRTEGGEARVRYGELMRDAGTAVWSATTSMATTRFPDPQTAADTITAWRDLLETSRRHGWVLLGSGTRVEGLRTSPGTTAVDRAAVALVDRLADLTRPRGRAEPTATREPTEPGPNPVGEVAARLADARRALGAASDLLATHRRLDGSAASPEAAVLDDPAVRSAGYLRLAEVTIPVLAAADGLGLRAGQAGMRWTRVAPAVPDTTAALDAAITLRVHARAGRDGALRLDRLRLTTGSSRGTPPLESSDVRHGAGERSTWATPR